MSSTTPPGPHGAGPDRAEVVVALSAVVLGLVVLVGSFTIDFGAGYDRIGPRLFPYLVAAGLILSGSLLAREALRRPARSTPPRRSPESASAIAMLGLGLVTSVLLLERAGFVLTCALLFCLVARAFASRRLFRDAVVGLVLSAAVYIAFTRGLGLVLPRGLLRGLL